MNKEYTYNMDKYTIGVDENGKDEIGLTIAIIKNGEINFLGNYYGENARCIDLLIKENQKLKQKYENAVADYETTMAEKNELKRQNNNFKTSLDESQEVIIDYIKENQELKEQLEEWKELLNKFKAQQKEFIKYMNDTIEDLETEDVDDEEMKGYLIQRIYTFKEILQKYKSIIGVSNEKEN